MAGSSGDRRRRGSIVWLPSGSARVKVYGGVDPITKRPLWLRETVKPQRTKRDTEREAEKVLTKLLNQVDERRSPRTSATVNQLLDRWLGVVDVERTTRVNYVGKIEKHKGRPSVSSRSHASMPRRSTRCTRASGSDESGPDGWARLAAIGSMSVTRSAGWTS